MIVKFDDQWREVGGYALPDAVLDRMAPMSTSGGAWGDDGLLYVTGHDRPELYAFRVPVAGSVLELVATIAIPFEGQAIDWDPKAKRLLWGISRKDRKAIAVTIPPGRALIAIIRGVAPINSPAVLNAHERGPSFPVCAANSRC